MNLIHWIGFAAFFVASLVIGLRLVALARRTGQIPELLIGVGVLGIGPFGYGLSMVAAAAAEHSTILSATLVGSALLAINVGALSQYLFVWMVFRRGQRLAQWAFYCAVALIAASYVLDIQAQGLVNRERAGLWYHLGNALRMGCLAWSSLESLRYFSLMKRRERLGLGDPVVTNRFLLWGLGAGAAFAGSVVGNVARNLFDLSPATTPSLGLALSLFGLVAAVAMWFAFLPPAAYLRRLEARAAPAPSDRTG